MMINAYNIEGLTHTAKQKRNRAHQQKVFISVSLIKK